MSSLQACVLAVKDAGKRFFKFGTGGCRRGKCIAEATNSANCDEGFVYADHYGFYEVKEDDGSENVESPTPAATSSAFKPQNIIDEICPQKLFTGNILCDDGS